MRRESGTLLEVSILLYDVVVALLNFPTFNKLYSPLQYKYILFIYSCPLTTLSMLSAKYLIFLLFSPAIEMRPFSVRYTCAFSNSALLCTVFSPVKLLSSIIISIFAFAHCPKTRARLPEHSDLVHNMFPFSRRLQLVSQYPEQLPPHVDDPVRHSLNIPFPLPKQPIIVQNQRHLLVHTCMSCKNFEYAA